MAQFRISIASASFVALLVTGCSTLQIESPDRNLGYRNDLATKTAVYSWRVSGDMFFSCNYDTQGFYWQFQYSQGKLYTDQGKHIATINPDSTITSKDGQSIDITPWKTEPNKESNNLKNLLYKVSSAPNKGLFSNVEYVERRNAKGGLPLTKCSAVQKSHLVSIPFEARYIFWR